MVLSASGYRGLGQSSQLSTFPFLYSQRYLKLSWIPQGACCPLSNFCFFHLLSRVSVLLESSICFLAYSRRMLGLVCSLWEKLCESSAPTELCGHFRCRRVGSGWDVCEEQRVCLQVAARCPLPQSHVWSRMLVLLRDLCLFWNLVLLLKTYWLHDLGKLRKASVS